jgi:molybdopterin adenylyltransferase
MPGVDESLPFSPLRIAVLTVSDTRTEHDDRSGATLVQLALKTGHELVERKIVKDEREAIVEQLRAWIDSGKVDAIMTTGGTGITKRDVTPEAVREVIEKEIPGFGELLRRRSYDTIGLAALLSRATAGVARGTLVFAMPGSTGACKDAWYGILLHQLDSRYRPCNLAELLPRVVSG